MRNMIITIVVMLITNLITNLILIDYFRMRHESRYSGNVNWGLIFIFGSITTGINCLQIPLLNLLVYITIFILLNQVFFIKERHLDSYINISFFVILLLMDMGVHFFVEYIIGVKETVGFNALILTGIKSIITSLIQYITFTFLKYYFMDKKVYSLSKRDRISYFFLSILSVIMVSAFGFSVNKVDNSVNITFFISSICITILNIYYAKIVEDLSEKYEMELSLNKIRAEAEFQYNHYRKIEDKNIQTSYLMHDIKNHLKVLESEMGISNENFQQYFDVINMKMSSLNGTRIISHNILNILFYEKRVEAKKKEIDIYFHIDDCDLSFMDDFDLVTIFSNLIDNAIEAVENLVLQDRCIDIYIKRIGEYLIIKEKNITTNQIIKKQGKILTTKEEHKGLGLLSIQNTLIKYDGTMVVDIKDKVFTNIISIPLT